MTHSLIQAWDGLVAAQPDTLAAIDQDQSWSRQELDDLAREVEASLDASNLRRHCVILHEKNSAQWLAAFIALRRAGAVVAPVDGATSDTACCSLAERLQSFAWQSGKLTAQPARARRWKSTLGLIKLTSGTSGHPSAIAFTEEELRADGENIMATMRFDATDLNYALLPLAHSYALGNLVAPLLSAGAPMVIGSAALPRIIADEIAATGATVFPSVPAVFESLSRTDDISLGRLRLCITAAAPLKPQLARQFHERFGLKLHNFYGASECGGIAYDRTGDAGLTGESVGTPMENVSLTRAADGRLRVRSKAVSSYRRTRDQFGAQVTLNDKVSFLDDGSLIVHGRLDRMVKCAGRRVDLSAIERNAQELEGVDQAVAVYLEKADRIVLAFTGSPNVEHLTAFLRNTFSTIHSRIRLKRIAEIPVNLRGKVDYRKLAVAP